MSLLNPLSDAFGVDIGDRSFKLVQASPLRGGKTYRITAWGSADVPEEYMERGEVKDLDKAAERLSALLHDVQGSVRGQAVVACLPEAKTFVKIIEAPKGAGPEALTQAVRMEIEQNIPLPASEIYFDWQVVEDASVAMPPATITAPDLATDVAGAVQPETKDAGAEKIAPEEKKPEEDAAEPEPAKAAHEPVTRILMGAAPKTLVDQYASLMEKAGLSPIALEIEAMAIVRALITPKDDERGEPVGILDIGATRSSLVVYDAGAIRMSISIPISGIAITKAVSEALNVSMDDAETLKRECGLDATRCEDKMWDILLPLIDDMTEKIRNALRFYRLGFPDGKKIERLVLCGGGAQFREIDTVLSRKLTIKVRKGDALANVDPRLPKGFPRGEAALPYTTAIGLAMRATSDLQHRDVAH